MRSVLSWIGDLLILIGVVLLVVTLIGFGVYAFSQYIPYSGTPAPQYSANVIFTDGNYSTENCTAIDVHNGCLWLDEPTMSFIVPMSKVKMVIYRPLEGATK